MHANEEQYAEEEKGLSKTGINRSLSDDNLSS